MKIYYDKLNNEITLTNFVSEHGPYDIIIINNRSIKTLPEFETTSKVYPIGYLLIEYVELDIDKIKNIIEDNFISTTMPENVDEILANIYIIRNCFQQLVNIHQYFYDLDSETKKFIYEYNDLINTYIKLLLYLQKDDGWFNNIKNIELLKDNFLYIKLHSHETDISYENNISCFYRSQLISIARDCTQKTQSTIKKFKSKLLHHIDKIIEFKKAVEFCLDYESIEDLKDLSILERFRIYVKINPKIKNNVLIPMQEFNDSDDDIGKDFSNLSISELKKMLPEEPLKLYECYLTGVGGVCYFEFLKLVTDNMFIRKCNNCNKYFISTGRTDTLYCDRVATNDGKTCKDVGAMNLYKKGIKDNPIMEEYSKTYKRNNARVRYKKISKDEFSDWSIKAREMRDKAKAGVITFEELKQWLNYE